MKKRILWLHNHTSLRKFELPLLLELGYEVYCPKIFEPGFGDGSASITWEYDESLSIPEEDLQVLNRTDFYENITEEAMAVMNRHFDMVMLHYFPQQLRTVVRGFQGMIIFQAFGLLGKASYTDAIIQDLGLPVLKQIQDLGTRFVFAQAYPHIQEVECGFFQRHNLYMPLGLQPCGEKTWRGGNKNFLFVLPRINTSAYFRKIYQDFTKDFAGMDYVIAGAQPNPVQNDPHVKGFLSAEEYKEVMEQSAAMFYHSREENHIHYHPLEAVAQGMPLVYMAGGMLDKLGGKNLPGRCRTVAEAKQKLGRLIRGDKILQKQILDSQDVLLTYFEYNTCKNHWINGMARIEQLQQQIAPCPQPSEKKIAVILPAPYLGGVLDYTLRLIRCIALGAQASGDPIKIVFGYPDEPVFQQENHFRSIQDLDINYRPFHWDFKKKQWGFTLSTLIDAELKYSGRYVALNDGIRYFEDCDYLIFTADRFPGKLMTRIPYTVVAHDYIQRYLPDMMGKEYEADVIDAVRKADCVFTTTAATFEDAVQYAGLKRSQILLTPLMFDLLERQQDGYDDARNYFLWSTNLAHHKNHKAALAALAEYYRCGGNLDCMITGVNTELLDVQRKPGDLKDKMTPYVEELRATIEKNPQLKQRITVKGNLPKQDYIRYLQKAAFVFHPGYGDNGNGTVIDAAGLGVPSCSSDYPAMRYIDSYVGLGLCFFDPFDDRSICRGLQEMEKNYTDRARMLPSRETLKQFTVEGKYREQYALIKKAMGGYQ